MLQPGHLLRTLMEAVAWYFFFLWFYAFKTVAKRGNAVVKRSGIGRLRQGWDLLLLQLGYQIPFRGYYSNQLYRLENKHRIHDQFYHNSLPWIHDFSNRNNERLKSARQLMTDKIAFAAAVTQAGFPCVRTLAVIGDFSEAGAFFQKKSVFCKPCSASQSRDAFLLNYDPRDHRYAAFPINGDPVTEQETLNAFLRSKATSPMLVQELLTDHPKVVALSGSEQITTLRLVSGRFRDGTTRAIYSQLEIPGKKKGPDGRQYYKIYPLEFPGLDVSRHWLGRVSASLEYDPALHVPGPVKQLVAKACRMGVDCHKALFTTQSVGFDFALTGEGPVFIEANYNWDIELLYRVIPDLTADNPGAQWLRELGDL
jgi:hypothetical protein